MKYITIEMDALAKAIDCNTDANEQEARSIINAVLYATPTPPVPSSVQEIMRLMNPYVRACMIAGLPHPNKAMDEARLAACDTEFKPLEAALTALVEKNHELQFSLDGVNAMRRPLTNDQIDVVTESQFGWQPQTILENQRKYVRVIERAHGIEPEQGEVK